MEIKTVTTKEEWEKFLLSQSPNSFLQSWNWGVFNEAIARKIFRLGAYEDNELVAVCLLVKQETRLADYFYCSRGPILDWKNEKLFKSLLQKTKELAKEEKVDFVKMDPLLPETPEYNQFFAEYGFKRAVTFVQVEDAWSLDLSKSEEELLADMRKTTRYLVRNEPKQGVHIELSASQEDIKDFVDLLFETAARKSFVNHTKSYYIKQFEIFAGDDQMRIFKSIRDGKVQAMAVIVFYGETAHYLHGASRPEAGSVGYSLQWAAIQEAKRRGLRYYNFWGVVKDKHFHPKLLLSQD